MAYYTKVLQPGETVRAVGRLHWLIFARAMLVLLLAIVVAVASRYPKDADTQRYILVVAGFLLVLAILIFLVAWVRRNGTEIVVTDRRVIYKRGFLARHTIEMNLSKVETVDVNQTFAGRLLGYGTVLVRGTGESLEPLRHISSPLAIRNAIDAA